MTKQQVLKNTVTQQWLVDFMDDWLTGRGPKSIPVWGSDKREALQATAVNRRKVAAAGVSFVLEA